MKPIDGDALAERVMYKFIYDPDYTLEDAIYDIQDAEELEKVVDVVRCKDCKYRDPEDKMCDCGHFIRWQLPRQDDWFCADGERRGDDEEE